MGSQHPLSNYYPVELHEDGKIFPTAEHLYQYRKAISLDLPEDADAISLAENPFRAMSLGNNLDAQCDIIHIDVYNDITAAFERPSLLLVQELSSEVKVRGIQYDITRYDPMTGMVGRDPTDSHYHSIGQAITEATQKTPSCIISSRCVVCMHLYSPSNICIVFEAILFIFKYMYP